MKKEERNDKMFKVNFFISQIIVSHRKNAICSHRLRVTEYTYQQNIAMQIFIVIDYVMTMLSMRAQRFSCDLQAFKYRGSCNHSDAEIKKMICTTSRSTSPSLSLWALALSSYFFLVLIDLQQQKSSFISYHINKFKQ